MRDKKTGPLLRSTGRRPTGATLGTEHAIYAAEAILEYPQSGERYLGRAKIQAQRGGHPAERRFSVLRIRDGGDLSVSECVITDGGTPTYSVSVMEFAGVLVTRETSTSPSPFTAPAWAGGARRAGQGPSG